MRDLYQVIVEHNRLTREQEDLESRLRRMVGLTLVNSADGGWTATYEGTTLCAHGMNLAPFLRRVVELGAKV